MKKVIWIVVVVLVVLFISGSCSAYNRMVTAEESVNTTWADVEAQYQRRSDLIPNLVNTVKGYAAHEQATFTEVVEARAQAMSFKLDAADLTPEKLAEFQQAQQKVGSALGRLIAVAEQYPDLKANQNFLELQAQLEGTENRIAVARTRFNDATRQYNVTIRRFRRNRSRQKLHRALDSFPDQHPIDRKCCEESAQHGYLHHKPEGPPCSGQRVTGEEYQKYEVHPAIHTRLPCRE